MRFPRKLVRIFAAGYHPSRHPRFALQPCLRLTRREADLAGLVTATIGGREEASSNRVSSRGDSILPLRRRFGSEDPQRGPRDEVALKVEGVVDGGVHAHKALGRSG